MTHTMQDDPAAYWNAAASRWIACQDMIDRVLVPVTASILEGAALQPGERVVDIGCGAGELTEIAATTVGPRGHALGVDVSTPFIEHARATRSADNLGFLACDAETHPLEPASRDVAISRFGVMFFRDSVAAFANIAGALSPGARVAFAVWQPIERNPRLTWALAAIEDLLTEAPLGAVDDADTPNPFRFADPARAREVLRAAGFSDVDVRGVDGTLSVDGSADTILDFMQQVGPFARAVEGLDDERRATAIARVTARIHELHDGTGIGYPGAWWIILARRG